MKKNTKGLCLLLAVAVCLSGVHQISAKTKYTKTEIDLAYTLACYLLGKLIIQHLMLMVETLGKVYMLLLRGIIAAKKTLILTKQTMLKAARISR